MEVLIRKKDIDDFDCLRADKLGIDKDLVSVEDLLGIIEDLLFECEHLKEVIEDMKNDMDSNYKRISDRELYCISDRDFYDDGLLM